MPYKDREQRNAYARKWYAENSEAHRKRTKKANDRQRAVLKDYIKQVKSEPCTDCNQRFPYVAMDFDHLRDKVINISRMIRTACSLDKLKEEIAKCELVCANCHRIRTWKRLETEGRPCEGSTERSE